MHYSMMQRTQLRAPMSDRHLERYPMSSSDLFNSNSSSDEDVSDLVYRNYRFNGNAPPPARLSDAPDEQLPMPVQRRPHSMQAHCMKCNMPRTNPKFRHSSVLPSQIRTQLGKFSASDGQYENESSSDEEFVQKSHKKRSFFGARRRNQLQTSHR